MGVLNPRCSLNHLAMLPVHRSQVSECSFSSTFPASGARDCSSKWDPRVTRGQPSGVGACRQSRATLSVRRGAREQEERGHRHFSDLPRRNSVSQCSAALHVRFPESQERLCKRNTRPPHNLPSLPENIHCHLPDFWNSADCSLNTTHLCMNESPPSPRLMSVFTQGYPDEDLRCRICGLLDVS